MLFNPLSWVSCLNYLNALQMYFLWDSEREGWNMRKHKLRFMADFRYIWVWLHYMNRGTSIEFMYWNVDLCQTGGGRAVDDYLLEHWICSWIGNGTPWTMLCLWVKSHWTSSSSNHSAAFFWVTFNTLGWWAIWKYTFYPSDIPTYHR